MKNKYIVDKLDLNDLKIENTNEFKVVVDPIPNTEIKKSIQDEGTKIIFKNKYTASILSNILGLDIKNEAYKDCIFTPEDDIYIIEFIGPKIPEDCNCLPLENDIFFLKLSIAKSLSQN